MSQVPRAKVKRILADLVPKFQANRRNDIALAREALARQDFVAVKAIGHRLKGSGAGYGFLEVSSHGAQIELASLSADARLISQVVDALEHYLDTVQIELI